MKYLMQQDQEQQRDLIRSKRSRMTEDAQDEWGEIERTRKDNKHREERKRKYLTKQED